MTKICVNRTENAASIYPSMIYDMVIYSLADIAKNVVANPGNPDVPTSSQANMASYSANYPPSLLQLTIIPVTSLFSLPISAVADFLVGLQALTHYLAVQEMTFGLFDMSSGDPNPIATGCLAFDCADFGQETLGSAQEGRLVTSTSSVSTAKPATLPVMSTPMLTTQEEQDIDFGIHVEYTTLPNANPITVQAYANVVSDMLWQIVGAIIASHGDALMPPWTLGGGHEYGIYVCDYWGSKLMAIVVQDHDAVRNLTLGYAALVLRLTMQRIELLNGGYFKESRADVGFIDQTGFAWPPGGTACFRYAGDKGIGVCQILDGTLVGNESSLVAGNDSTTPPLMLPAENLLASLGVAQPATTAVYSDPNATS